MIDTRVAGCGLPSTVELGLDNNPDGNPFATLVAEQKFMRIPHFTLESGAELRDFVVAYKTWGRLDAKRMNCMVICHALTGSADVEDW